ncbi:seven-hairpin glycosidase [Ophiobolus disseminans]|uniref:alpha-1,2-Mannosidase n=1 Tax=Ophiobolus disseminans TaxID=1469910 RepID=A0A6A6ZUG7_9PLEO|nr:seven-hairpin glycosidase [Ophiobolus disseminans]
MLSTRKFSSKRPYQRLLRQLRRRSIWLLSAFLTCSIYYLWSTQPLDPLAVSFRYHEIYMNQRASQTVLHSKQSYDWRNAPFVNKVESYISIPTGVPRELPQVQFKFKSETAAQRYERESRKLAVRNEFQRTWESYRNFSWAPDELRPTSGHGVNTFGGWGATLVDSLDTLWIMGFKEYFHEAVQAVAAIDFGQSDMQTVSVFETTIRYLGGLLSAYDLSHEPVLLYKAIQVGEMLYRAFDTTNNTPLSALHIEIAKKTDREEFSAERNICFACFGSLSMEFTRLAQLTSDSKYYDAVAKLSLMMERSQNSTKIPGLWPTHVNSAMEIFNESGSFSIGALADSTYEYLPKMHALLGGLDPVYEKLHKDAAAMIDRHMLFRPMIPDEALGEDLLYCGDVSSYDGELVQLVPDMQHLTCFIGGMFGLAGRFFEDDHQVDLGAKLTKGCIFAYEAMPSGIMPESFTVMPCQSRTACSWNETAWEDLKTGLCGINGELGSPDFGKIEPNEECHMVPGFSYIRDKRYLLRPEAIESVFIMYRITGDRVYLDYAWNMFTSIVTATRTKHANGQLRDVTLATPTRPGVKGGPTREDNIEDKMESFWTAETLKYFYLIFSRPDMISLDDWVFNTEAHPFRRPKASNAQDLQ